MKGLFSILIASLFFVAIGCKKEVEGDMERDREETRYEEPERLNESDTALEELDRPETPNEELDRPEREEELGDPTEPVRPEEKL